jgi:hypothetical protein
MGVGTDVQIMELYMSRPSDAGSAVASALGHLKSHGSVVHVNFQLGPAVDKEEAVLGIEQDRKGRKLNGIVGSRE